MRNFICIFDCESIPDLDLIKKSDFYKSHPKLDGEALSDAFCKDYEEKNGTTFLPLPYHKIVCICAVLATEFGDFIKVDKMPGENEKELIENFFNMINKSKPRLVSFNGKGFDLPVLVLRAMKYGLDASSYLDDKDKWNNYKSKFAENKHCDLLESLSGFGNRGMRLDLLCKMMDFPGKYDVSGDQVSRLFYENKLEKIEEYCESDVLNTYLLFLQYELTKGLINQNDYKTYLENMHAYLSENQMHRDYAEVFIEDLEAKLS